MKTLKMLCDLTILFFIIITCCSNVSESQIYKCCGKDSYLSTKNSSLECNLHNFTRNSNKRLILNNLKYNFIQENDDGTCVDFSNTTLYNYTISNGTISSKIATKDPTIFPKCCPLGSAYNSITHSCIKNPSKVHFNDKIFLKIGLEKCRIIADYLIPSLRENRTLKFEKEYRTLKDGNYCLDEINEDLGDDKFVVRVCMENYDICKKIRCIRKCCPDGQTFVNRKLCVDTFEYGIDLEYFDNIVDDPAEPFAIIHQMSPAIYILENNFHLQTDGTFTRTDNKTHTDKIIPYDEEENTYCIEHLTLKRSKSFNFFFTVQTNKIGIKFVIERWVKCVSCLFLFLTILVYACSPTRRNMFGKILLSYCTATFWFFIILIVVQFRTDHGDTTCIVLGYTITFLTLSSFTWLNVMSIDIYLTFGTLKSSVGYYQQAQDLRKFILYNIYGWGMPVMIVAILAVFVNVEFLPTYLQPSVGKVVCLIDRYKGNYAYLLFLGLPLAILEIVDVILFFKTIRYCLNAKNELKKMGNMAQQKKKSNKLNADQEKLSLIIKLSIIMGIVFIMEIVTMFVNFKVNPVMAWIEIIWDIFNCSQGVFIFIIFICKKRTFHELQSKLRLAKLRSQSISSSITHTSNLN